MRYAATFIASSSLAILASLLSAPSAHAGAGDDPAGVIASRTAPGETTSQSCGGNGFVIVTFSVGSSVVSTVESGTPCSSGGGGGSSGGSTPADSELQAIIENDLQVGRQNAIAQGIMDQLDSILEENPDAGFEAFDELGDGTDEEGTEFSDEEKAALLSSYRRQLSEARSDLRSLRSKLSDLRSELQDAKIAADANMPKLIDDLRAAQAALAGVQYEAQHLPTARDLAAAEAELEARREELEQAQALASDPNYPRPAYAQNMAGAAQARLSLAEIQVTDARKAHTAATAAFEAEAQADVQRAAAAIDGSNARVRNLETQISNAETEMSFTQSTVSRLEALIRTLEQQNQFAGPSGDAFETLRAQGLEFWSRGSLTFVDDTRSGRRQEGEQKDITLGGHGRLSERLIVGLAFSYVDGKNEDQTGTGISSDTESFLLAPYLAYRLSEDLALEANAVYGITDISQTRARVATASYDATTIGGQISLSARHKLSKEISLTGRVGQSYVTTDSDGYTDTGGLTVESSDKEQAVSSLSGRVNVTTDPDWRWHGALKVRYDMIDPGNNQDRFYGALSTGLEYNSGTYAVAVQASRTVFRSQYEATGFSLQIRVPF